MLTIPNNDQQIQIVGHEEFANLTRLNAFARSCPFNATAEAAQCHSQQTNSQSLARRHNQVRNV